MTTHSKINRQLMIEMRLGLNGQRQHTIAAIGKKFNLSRQRVYQLLRRYGAEKKIIVGDQKIFTSPQLIKQPWFPIKTLVTLRKFIDAGKIKAVDVSVNPKLKRYQINKQEVVRFLNAWDDVESNSVGIKNIQKDKNYFTCPALVKQRWFPVKSVITLRKLINQDKIKAINLSTSPKVQRYYIHKDEAIRYIATILKEV